MDTNEANILITLDAQFAIMSWNGTITGEEYKNAHQNIYSTIAEYEVSKWIFDYQKSRKILYEDLVWTVSDWLPKLLADFSKIISKIAVVVSKNVFSKVSIKIIAYQIAKKGIDVAYFNNREEAAEWLSEKD
jgi:hypothetical protein